ncbi:MAG: YhcH/YjgK/YiaL family protein [Bacteroidaceae bacterium]|nr:YhcH/YjgK/YiaL family protein [Bacteroidaceae bacterium]
MIIDKLENLKNYVPLNPLFADVVAFIENTDLGAQPAGKVFIKGDELFANFNVCKGKKKGEPKLETHDVMIDIQVPLNHAETMGYKPRTELSEAEYDESVDMTLYDDEPQQYVTVAPGMFVIFFPQDGHAPAICDCDELHKIIFKVKA